MDADADQHENEVHSQTANSVSKEKPLDYFPEIDYKQEDWCVQLFTHLGLSSRFPADVVAALSSPEPFDYEEDKTPDGTTSQDWINNPRPSLLRNGEEYFFERFSSWFEGMRIGFIYEYDFQFPWSADGTWHPHVSDRKFLIDISLKIRGDLSHEQMSRFVHEVREQKTPLSWSASNNGNSTGEGVLTMI